MRLNVGLTRQLSSAQVVEVGPKHSDGVPIGVTVITTVSPRGTF